MLKCMKFINASKVPIWEHFQGFGFPSLANTPDEAVELVTAAFIPFPVLFTPSDDLTPRGDAAFTLALVEEAPPKTLVEEAFTFGAVATVMVIFSYCWLLLVDLAVRPTKRYNILPFRTKMQRIFILGQMFQKRFKRAAQTQLWFMTYNVNF